MTLKQFLGDAVRDAGKKYLDDLEAMPEEVLAKSPGGVARTPLDYSYEIGLINRRIAARLRGEDPGAWPGPTEGWMVVSAEFANKAAMVDLVRSSFEEIDKAWDAFDEDELATVIPLPNGETSAIDLASLASRHAMYHDGQLNYAQSISGDDVVHWQG
ncbi:MAG: DinB family protein [Armatimonadota bacterium]|nr:DinB family protein [Armatimonadota bacterium]